MGDSAKFLLSALSLLSAETTILMLPKQLLGWQQSR